MTSAAPKLDQRLALAASFFPACESSADIGADHGRLSCGLLLSGTCESMLVSDISERSLAKAKRLLETHGLSARARFVVADGLDALDAADTPVSALAILGMGGASIAGILLRGRQKLAGAKLILSAHTDLFALRKAVYDIGYHLAREAIAVAGSRRYIVMLAETGERAVGDRELYIGPCLLRDRPEGFDDYLAWRERVISREWEPGERLQWIREAIGHATGDGSGHL